MRFWTQEANWRWIHVNPNPKDCGKNILFWGEVRDIVGKLWVSGTSRKIDERKRDRRKGEKWLSYEKRYRQEVVEGMNESQRTRKRFGVKALVGGGGGGGCCLQEKRRLHQWCATNYQVRLKTNTVVAGIAAQSVQLLQVLSSPISMHARYIHDRGIRHF